MAMPGPAYASPAATAGRGRRKEHGQGAAQADDGSHADVDNAHGAAPQCEVGGWPCPRDGCGFGDGGSPVWQPPDDYPIVTMRFSVEPTHTYAACSGSRGRCQFTLRACRAGGARRIHRRDGRDARSRPRVSEQQRAGRSAGRSDAPRRQQHGPAQGHGSGSLRPKWSFITGHASVDTAVEALRMGASDYLTKPLDIPRLKTVLANIARTRELKDEIDTLRAELRKLGRFGPMIGASPPMGRVYDLIARVAPDRRDGAHHRRERHRQGAGGRRRSTSSAGAARRRSCRSTAVRCLRT